MAALTARPSERRRRPPCKVTAPGQLATLAVLVSLLASCGGPTPTATPTLSQQHSPSATAAATPSRSPTVTSYCDAVDTPIPGAAAALATGQALNESLNPVQELWFQMWASAVPACSEITPNPPMAQSKNMTDGELSDAALAAWLAADDETLTLIEWAQRHDQPNFIQQLHWGTAVSSFVAAGGKVEDDRACEYPGKVYAVSVTAQQMADLTSGQSSNPGIAYIQAAVGPCTSVWTTEAGAVTPHDVASGQEDIELDVTTLKNSPAVGTYLSFVASWDQGGEPTADSIISESGI